MEQEISNQPPQVSTTNEGDLSGNQGARSSSDEVGAESETIKVPPKIKRPIFIATGESNVVNYIESALFGATNDSLTSFLDKEEYTVMVLNADMFKHLNQQYLFTLLNDDEQKRAQSVALNKDLHEKALGHALQIDSYLKKKRNLSESDRVLFNQTELRVALNEMKRAAGEKMILTHQDTWNVMDLLVLKGFLIPERIEDKVTARHKRIYCLMITDVDRLKTLQQQSKQLIFLVDKYSNDLIEIKDEISKLSQKIDSK